MPHNLTIVRFISPSDAYVHDVAQLLGILGQHSSDEQVRARLRSPDVVGFGACDGQHVYGFTSLSIRRPDRRTKYGVVEDFIVHSDARNANVGRHLLHTMINFAREEGFSYLQCRIPPTAGALIGLFTGLDFVTTDATIYTLQLKR